MKTREEAEARALELYPMQVDTQGDYVYGERRKAFLQCWDEMQKAKQKELLCEMMRKDEEDGVYEQSQRKSIK